MTLTELTIAQRLATMCCAIEIVNANGNIAVEELQQINKLSQQLLLDDDLNLIAKEMHLDVAMDIIKRTDVDLKRLFAKTLIDFVDCENNIEDEIADEIRIFNYICLKTDIDVDMFKK